MKFKVIAVHHVFVYIPNPQVTISTHYIHIHRPWMKFICRCHSIQDCADSVKDSAFSILNQSVQRYKPSLNPETVTLRSTIIPPVKKRRGWRNSCA